MILTSKMRLPGARPKRSAARTLVTLIGAPLLGVAIGFAVLVFLLLPHLGVGEVERIVQLGLHLEEKARSNKPFAAFLGDSVTMEGIDASIVESAVQHQWHIENLALSGFGFTELQIILPKVLDADLQVVVIAFATTSFASLKELPPDKAYAYAMGGFVRSWPPGYSCQHVLGLGQSTCRALHSSPLEQRLHFRTAPLNWMNQRLRFFFRSDLGVTRTADWDHPYRMVGAVSKEVSSWHLDEIRALIRNRHEEGQACRKENVEQLLERIKGEHVTPLLVIQPVHPRLRKDAAPLLAPLRTALQDLARVHQMTVVDASTFLDEEQFADAVHPNSQGRGAYSRLIGEHLPPAPLPRGIHQR